MKIWKVELTAGRRGLAEAKVQKGIFQEDALCTTSVTIYNCDDATVCKKWKITGNSNTRSEIYSQNIGMEFGIEKCAMLVMKSGKRQITEGKELPNKEKLRTLRKKETFKYLGILEADTIKQEEKKNQERVS